MYVKSFEYDLNKPSTNFTNGQWVKVNSLNFQLYNIDGVVYLVNNKKIVKKLDKVLNLFYSGTILNFATNVKIKRARRRHTRFLPVSWASEMCIRDSPLTICKIGWWFI